MHKTVRRREAAIDAGLGKAFCHIDMGSDAPDNSGMNAAAMQQAQLSAEQLAWAKQLYAETAPQRAETQARQNAVSDKQLALMGKAETAADEAAARSKAVFQPAEDKLVSDALAYNTPQRREQMAGEAMAGVDTQVGLAKEGITRDLADMGTDASSGSAAIALSRLALGQGAARAAAGNTARRQVETVGDAKLADAVALGRGVVGNQATQASLALNSGNSAAGTAGQASATGMSGGAIMNSGYSGAQQGLAGSASTYGQIAGIENQANANEGAGWAGLGQLAGTIGSAMLLSDEGQKEGKTPVSGEEALVALEKTPVTEWSYKEGSVADDGGQRHVGPMAQDVQASMGDKVAPGGKQIDPVSANGVTMAAVKELDKRTARIEDEVIALRKAIAPSAGAREARVSPKAPPAANDKAQGEVIALARRK